MSTFTKYWLFVLILGIASIWLVRWANSDEGLVESSYAAEKNRAPQRDMNKLFNDMGVNFTERANPCMDLERYAQTYCTPHGLSLLLAEHTFVEVEDRLLRKFLKSPDPCVSASQYIGRVCDLQNMKRIFKHFALKK